MRITFTGIIVSMIRDTTYNGEKIVRVSIDLDGDVEGQSLGAKKAKLSGALELKPIVAEQLKLGSKIQVVLTDDQ